MDSRRPALLSLHRRLSAAAALAACAVAAQAHDLTIEVLDARSDKGSVVGAVYGDEAGWLKESSHVQGDRQPATAGKVVLVYRGLPPGRYAVSVFHDENANGKLDTNLVGLPTERYGFSRDARGRMGPPSFADAAVELTGDATLTVRLR